MPWDCRNEILRFLPEACKGEVKDAAVDYLVPASLVHLLVAAAHAPFNNVKDDGNGRRGAEGCSSAWRILVEEALKDVLLVFRNRSLGNLDGVLHR